MSVAGTYISKVVEIFVDLRSPLLGDKKEKNPEGEKMHELMLVKPEFFREQKADHTGSKHVRTYNRQHISIKYPHRSTFCIVQ